MNFKSILQATLVALGLVKAVKPELAKVIPLPKPGPDVKKLD